MIFRQLFDASSSTYTYLLGDEAQRKAVLIDPVFEQHARDAALLRELGLDLVATLDTHVHADHVTAAWLFARTHGSRIAVSKRSGAEGADMLVDDGDVIPFGDRSLQVMATPGHTSGCLTYVLDDRSMAFTGDALLVRGTGRTDFQNGDAHALFASITKRIFSLPDTCLLYPAHDYVGRTVTTVAEEKAWNPRVGGAADERDFTYHVQNLGLPHPKKIDVAVPANLKCGRTEGERVPDALAWGPVHTTYAGVPEIDPTWVAEHQDRVVVLDVREPDELTGPEHRIRGEIVHVPLGQLRGRLDAVPTEKPVVVVCRSGRRSAQGALILREAGRRDVANLTGGMLRWNALELPVS